jgi:hypothetical protein
VLFVWVRGEVNTIINHKSSSQIINQQASSSLSSSLSFLSSSSGVSPSIAITRGHYREALARPPRLEGNKVFRRETATATATATGAAAVLLLQVCPQSVSSVHLPPEERRSEL